MTVPQEYISASRDFEAALVDVRDRAMLSTTHRAFTTLEAVLRVFRRRLTPDQSLAFAGLLKPGLRALFVADWTMGEPAVPFDTRLRLQEEVMFFRRDHNLSPDTAIQDVTQALRLHMGEEKLKSFLKSVSSDALSFWGFSTEIE
ncbi:DUF2267 domain-containing protein [uncultured Agrobacterium sp.]|uniref:DUF2267 domain-containing protein n=1 Tax=uncultured Agrobacterium sp. TaxID=157277 RepID=UPI0025F98F78|nr:DUF2267 domain-containing protein [uncultured Agrobacterium sp.]